MAKQKILWIVYDFNQAGGQRYVYEICKALNKEQFEIHILKFLPFGTDKNWTEEYYYQPTLELGCKVFLLEDVLKEKSYSISKLQKIRSHVDWKIAKWLKRPAKNVTNKIHAALLARFFNEYSWVNFSGINVYKSICCGYNIFPGNALIHILTFKFQSKMDIYEGVDKTHPYRFVSGLPPETFTTELADFKNYQHFFYPLSFHPSVYEPSNSKKTSPFVIAVFTRLSVMKPLDVFFYAIKLLTEMGVDAVLHIYGAGDPYEMGLIRQLRYMHIESKVKFMGHVKSMKTELKKGEIDLIWFQSNNQQPGGYAALEIALSGLPQIFWDFSNPFVETTYGTIFPSFTHLTSFVNYSNELLLNAQKRKELGSAQKKFVLDNHSIESNIHILEELFSQ